MYIKGEEFHKLNELQQRHIFSLTKAVALQMSADNSEKVERFRDYSCVGNALFYVMLLTAGTREYVSSGGETICTRFVTRSSLYKPNISWNYCTRPNSCFSLLVGSGEYHDGASIFIKFNEKYYVLPEQFYGINSSFGRTGSFCGR